MSKNAVEMRLEEHGDVFVDIYNNLYFGGKEIIREEDLVPLPTTSYARKMDGNLRGGMRDIRKENQFGNRYRLVCGLENQTGIDNTMPVRVIGYDYADYEDQIKKIEVQNEQNGKPAGSKRIYKNQKLTPVATGVLYYGEANWNTPKRLYDMLEFPEGIDEEIKKLVVDYPINIVQVARLTDEERGRLKSDFRLVAEYVACRGNKEKWKAFLRNGNHKIRHVEELLDVLWELSKDERYFMLIDKIRNEEEKEEWHMCELAEYLENIGIEKGMKDGIRSGIFAMIKDNLEENKSREQIVKKLVRYFAVSEEDAGKYYNELIAG